MIDWYVGQEVYLEPVENMKELVSSLVPGVVEKVGCKYVHVRPIGFGSIYKFRRENGVGEYDMSPQLPQWRLYLSKKDYEDAVEAREIAGRLYEIFAWRSFAANNIPLENLRRILKLAETTCPKN